jgi:hypothetical protein
MSAMFCGNFNEQVKPMVAIPEIDEVTLKYCLYFLYLDQCPKTKDVYEAMEVLSAADRFCMPRLMDLLQDHIVSHYLTLPTEELDNSRSDCIVSMRALELLEVAEVTFADFPFFEILLICCLLLLTRHSTRDICTVGAAISSPLITCLSHGCICRSYDRSHRFTRPCCRSNVGRPSGKSAFSINQSINQDTI